MGQQIMYVKFIWKIIPKETPFIEINCSRCSNNRFICSNKFRINSNKKLSDVWLIYKCSHCENTWNMNILTRKNLSQIKYDLFCRFQENNIELAWHYAFNKSIAKSNKVRLNNHIDFEISDHQGHYLDSNDQFVSIAITSEYELPISIKKILQKKLNLSANQIVNLHQEGTIIINENKNFDLSKKIGLGCRLLINLTQLKSQCFHQ